MTLPSDTKDYNAPFWSPKIRPGHYGLCSLCSVISRKQYPSWCSSLKLLFMCLNPKIGTLASYEASCMTSLWLPHVTSSVTLFHSVLPVLPKLGPQTSPLWWCTLYYEPPAMLPATVFWDGAGGVMPCVVYLSLPAWCDGRNAHLSLCKGSSERVQGSTEKAETEIPLPLFQQLVLPGIGNLQRKYNFLCSPKKNFWKTSS